MGKKRMFEIYYNDLTKLAKKELLQAFNTFEENENWDDIPLCVIEREFDEEESEKGLNTMKDKPQDEYPEDERTEGDFVSEE
jgi:lipoprotein NlpI